jgi:WD40 repeat protein
MKHEDRVRGARFTTDGQRILTWSEDGTARLWSATNSQCIILFGHTADVTAASFNRDETRVLTASNDGTAQLWDISLDDRISLDERILEFEVRSATTLGDDGQVRVLTTREWHDRREKLLRMEIQSHLALTPSGSVRTLTSDDMAAKQRQLDEIRKNRSER